MLVKSCVVKTRYQLCVTIVSWTLGPVEGVFHVTPGLYGHFPSLKESLWTVKYHSVNCIPVYSSKFGTFWVLLGPHPGSFESYPPKFIKCVSLKDADPLPPGMHIQQKDSYWYLNSHGHVQGDFSHDSWLVVSLPFFIFPFSWECHHPNWRSRIFFRGVAHPPTSDRFQQIWCEQTGIPSLHWAPRTFRSSTLLAASKGLGLSQGLGIRNIIRGIRGIPRSTNWSTYNGGFLK